MFNRIKRGIALFLCAISVFIFNPSYLMPMVYAESSAAEVVLSSSGMAKVSYGDPIFYMWKTPNASATSGYIKVSTENAHLYLFYNTTDKNMYVLADNNTVTFKLSDDVNRTCNIECIVNGVNYYYYKFDCSPGRYSQPVDGDHLDSSITSYASLDDALAYQSEVLFVDETDGTVIVTASVEAGYTVKLPAVMQLTYNSSTRRFEYNYTVSVKGIVDENKMLAVVPNASVSLYNAARTEYLTANVIQTKSYWVNDVTDDSTQNLIDYGTYTEATGVCYLNKVKSGNWSGLLHFTFSIVDQ